MKRESAQKLLQLISNLTRATENLSYMVRAMAAALEIQTPAVHTEYIRQLNRIKNAELPQVSDSLFADLLKELTQDS